MGNDLGRHVGGRLERREGKGCRQLLWSFSIYQTGGGWILLIVILVVAMFSFDLWLDRAWTERYDGR